MLITANLIANEGLLQCLPLTTFRLEQKRGNNYFCDEFFARLDQLVGNLIKRCEKLMDSTLIEFRVLEVKFFGLNFY